MAKTRPPLPSALDPNTTHRLDVLAVQLAAVSDHGVNDVSQAGSLHVRVLDEHKVLRERAEAAGPGQRDRCAVPPGFPARGLGDLVPFPQSILCTLSGEPAKDEMPT